MWNNQGGQVLSKSRSLETFLDPDMDFSPVLFMMNSLGGDFPAFWSFSSSILLSVLWGSKCKLPRQVSLASTSLLFRALEP
jgi:hypothetical protein